MRTPRYNGHPDITDSSQIPGKNKLQMFDWNKLAILRTLASEDTNSGPHSVRNKGSWLYLNFIQFQSKRETLLKCSNIACVASVSVRFRRKERGTRVKDREKSGASKRAGSLCGSRFISRAVKTESPLPQYFFAPKPNGNACYAGLQQHHWKKKIILKFSGNWKFGKTIHNKNHNDANWMRIFITKNFLKNHFPGQEEAVCCCCFFLSYLYRNSCKGWLWG